MTTPALQPTWFGHVATARDALKLFEACLQGILNHVPRRPHDRERPSLIRSGCVFIYEENASGIKRWTDGVPWSPSRILGNFLVYRELVKPFPPGEKKRATKRSKRHPTRPGEPYPRQNTDGTPTSPTTPGARSENGVDNREGERALIGSLVDSYGFKEGGLVKKTMSVQVNGVHHHLVSYYTLEDALTEGLLKLVKRDHRLAHLEPRNELITRQNFRSPLDTEDDHQNETLENSQQTLYGSVYDHSYDRRPYSNGAPQGHPPMGLSLYNGDPNPYTPTSQVHHGVPSYPTMPQPSHGFYQPGMPIQHPPPSYSQAAYPSHPSQLLGPGDRPSSQSQQHSDYGYHRHYPASGQGPRLGLMPAQNGMHEQNSRNPIWPRGNQGMMMAPNGHSSSMTTSPSYTVTNSPGLAMHQPNPRTGPINPDLPWSGSEEAWEQHQQLQPRHPDYSNQQQ